MATLMGVGRVLIALVATLGMMGAYLLLFVVLFYAAVVICGLALPLVGRRSTPKEKGVTPFEPLN